MGSSYVSVTVELEEQDAELAAFALHEAGATGLEVRDREAPPMPGVRGPDPGEAILVAFFDGEAAARAAQQEVQEQFPAPACRWSRWRRRTGPRRGRRASARWRWGGCGWARHGSWRARRRR